MGIVKQLIIFSFQNIIPNNINEELERVTHSNISEIVVVFNSGLIEIEKELQAEIDHSQYRWFLL